MLFDDKKWYKGVVERRAPRPRHAPPRPTSPRAPGAESRLAASARYNSSKGTYTVRFSDGDRQQARPPPRGAPPARRRLCSLCADVRGVCAQTRIPDPDVQVLSRGGAAAPEGGAAAAPRPESAKGKSKVPMAPRGAGAGSAAGADAAVAGKV